MRLTGFRTYREFIEKTEPMERKLIAESIREWHDSQQPRAGGGGGGGPPGMGL